MSSNAFHPTGATLTVAASVASAGAALDGSVGESVRILNATANIAFVKSGVGAQTATAADIPIPAGSCEVMRFPTGHTHIACILAGGTGNVYFTRGEGI